MEEENKKREEERKKSFHSRSYERKLGRKKTARQHNGNMDISKGDIF